MDLAELIRTAKGDRSYDDLARAAGGTPGRQRWHQLVNGPIKNFPDPPTIRAIAGALGVTQRTVVLAAAESLGLDTGDAGGRVEQMLPPGLDELPRDEQDVLLSLARVLTRREGPGTGVNQLLAATTGSASDADHKGDYARAARPGVPAHGRDATTGEESQDDGGDEPA